MIPPNGLAPMTYTDGFGQNQAGTGTGSNQLSWPTQNTPTHQTHQGQAATMQPGQDPPPGFRTEDCMASMLMPTQGGAPLAVAHYAILDQQPDGNLMQFIALKCWNLREPKVLISVTGGAQDFSMSRVDDDKVMQGLMHIAVETSVWFVTGGTNAGIMKLVGEARLKYSANAPLIGVAAWGALKAQEEIARHANGRNLPGDKLLTYSEVAKNAEERDKAEVEERDKAEVKKPALDPGHSHFFLIKGKQGEKNEWGFGDEIESRAAFENQIKRKDGPPPGEKEGQLEPGKIKNYEKWTGDRKKINRGNGSTVNDSTVNDPTTSNAKKQVPVVVVCVQGGPGTVKTVISAIEANSPVLIVKGSGKAADLIADIIHLEVLRRDSDAVDSVLKQTGTKLLLTPKQERLKKFLEQNDERSVKNIVDAGWQHDKSTLKIPADQRGVELNEILNDYWGSGIRGTSLKKPMARAFQDAVRFKDHNFNKLCTVFDLRGEKPLSNSILECIFSAVTPNPWDVKDEEIVELGENEKKELKRLQRAYSQHPEGHVERKPSNPKVDAKMQLMALVRKLKLAVEFNNLEILKTEVGKAKGGNDEAFVQEAMGSALDTALLKRSRPEIVDYLVNHGAKVDGYWLKVKPKEKKIVIERWTKLARTVPGNILHPKLTRNQWLQLLEKEGDLKNLKKKGQSGFVEPSKIPKSLLTPSPASSQSFLRTPSRKNLAADSEELERLERFESEKFERFFAERIQEIVGAGFAYKMSAISPEFDLMALAALKNDRDLAAVWWKEYAYPVRAALSIAMLYRNLAKARNMIPHDKVTAEKSAEFFEILATQVQNFSFEQDYFLALSSLEQPLLIWNGNTLVDVAIRSESEIFLTNCCREAIDRRFAGDLQAYDQYLNTWLARSWLPAMGLKFKILLNLCVLGFLAPKFMKFEKFPLAYNLRYPTQRIKTPDTFRKDAGRTHVYDEREVARSTEYGDMAEVVDSEMKGVGYWQKLKLFWQAPITLFLAGAMQKTFIVISFTWWLFVTPDPRRGEAFFLSKAISPEFDSGWGMDWAVFPYEVGLFVLFTSSVISEIVQWIVQGLEYLNDFWNILDLLSSAFFFIGFTMRFACSNGSGLFLREWCTNPSHWDQVESVRVDGMWVYMYSICVFLLWIRMLRLLSVSSRMGPFVILIIRMGFDISMFAVVYLIFLGAFSVLIRGSMPYSYPQCTGTDDDPDAYKCWTMWWVVRTFIQAAGIDSFLEDMTTDAAVIGYMIIWVIMSLLLLNLVIAIMSSTYNSVKEKSEKVFLADLHDITNEFSRRSVAAPWPLNVIFIIIDTVHFFVNKETVDTIWPSQPNRNKYDLFLRRNMHLKELSDRKVQKDKFTFPKPEPKPKPTPGQKQGGNDTKEERDEKEKMVQRDMEVEQFWELKLASFAERARNKFLEADKWKDLKKEWKLQDADHDETEDAKSKEDQTQTLLDAIRVASQVKREVELKSQSSSNPNPNAQPSQALQQQLSLSGGGYLPQQRPSMVSMSGDARGYSPSLPNYQHSPTLGHPSVPYLSYAGGYGNA